MAATRDTEAAEGKGYTHVRGTFFPNGSSAPTTTPATGGAVGWSVAWTSTGLWTITFTQKYPCLVSKTATIQMAAATDIVPQFGTFTAATATTPATLVIKALAAAAVTDIAANANNSVSFDVCFSSVASTK